MHIRCTKCGELGHNRSSRLCPLWGVGDPEETRDEAFRDGTVKQDHGFGKLKLKIDSTKLVTNPPPMSTLDGLWIGLLMTSDDLWMTS